MKEIDLHPSVLSKFRHAPPRASVMIEALRGLGYSTATAISDIIDNSISANSASVELNFSWAAELSHVSILDDGCGMDAASLDSAMRLGEKSPLDSRSSHDLGRFGLGLKTASFSQCRRLTVASISGGQLHCLRWDLDFLASSSDDGWFLLEGPENGSEHLLDPLIKAGKGTIVIWECLDRIVSPGFSEQNFLDLIDAVERHLAMIFHRFLDGPHPHLNILINGRRVKPWDPFLSNHPATWSSPVEKICSVDSIVEVQCYVLPHKDFLAPNLELSAAGPHGWTAQQGFYVYRNKRLLLAGSWLGLGQGRSWTKEEAHRLARLRLDIPNSADANWKIDIRKSSATPPVGLRNSLTLLAEETRARARRVFAHRGQPVRINDGQPVAQAWRTEHTASGVRYRIDRSHPAIHSVLEDAGNLCDSLKAMLRVIEETVPVQRIWLDTTEGRETPRNNFEGAASSEVLSVLSVMYKNYIIRKGFSPSLAKERLMNTEPFNNYPDIIASLPENPEDGENNAIID